MLARVALLSCLAVSGCSPGAADLYVDLKTDLVSPDQFVAVNVEVRRAGEAEPMARSSRPAFDLHGDLLDGVRVSELRDLAPGDLVVELALADAIGTVVVSRRVAFTLRDDRVLTIVISRDCIGVRCPLAADAPELTECLGGRCVAPECDTDAPDTCGEPECTADGACPMGPSCTHGRCVDGVCLLATDGALCPSGQRCDVVAGCTSACGGCDDGNPCTDDACGATGCEHTPNTARCDDGTFCNGPDTCAGGACSTHAGDPCAPPTTCDEDAATCAGCQTSEDCPPAMDGPWSPCAGFADACAASGTHTRTLTAFTCSGSTCVASTSDETDECTRDTDGISCGPGGAACASGACACPGGTSEASCADGTDDDCDGDIDCADSDCDAMDCGGGRACSSGACACPGGTPTDVTDGSAAVGGLDIAWNGAELDIVYMLESSSGGYDYALARVSEDGSIIESGLMLTTTASVAQPPELVWTGSEYGIAWSDVRGATNDVYFRRFAADGTLLGSEMLVAGGSELQLSASILWQPGSPGAYRVVWSHGTTSDTDLSAWLYAVGGSPFTYADFVNTPGVADSTTSLWVSSSGATVFHEDDDALHAYLAIDNPPAITRVDDGPGPASIVDLAFDGTRIGLAWTDGRDGNDEIYFASASVAGAVAANVRVTNAAGSSTQADLAWGASSYGLVWQDARSGAEAVYFRELSSAGALIGAERVLSCTSGAAVGPAVAWSGSRWAVAWVADDGTSSRVRVLSFAP